MSLQKHIREIDELNYRLALTQFALGISLEIINSIKKEMKKNKRKK